jgi:hypothetical protein
LKKRDFVGSRQRFEAGLKLNDRDINAWLYYVVSIHGTDDKEGTWSRETGALLSAADKQIDELFRSTYGTDWRQVRVEQEIQVVSSFYRFVDRAGHKRRFDVSEIEGKNLCGPSVAYRYSWMTPPARSAVNYPGKYREIYMNPAYHCDLWVDLGSY